MKKINKFFRALALGFLVFALCVPTVACGNKTQQYNPEERPLSMALGTPDGVFNPFFSTSAIDGQVIALTQISMLNSDKDGKVTYGDNEPTVVQDYTQTENGTGSNKTTTYKFLIKNGIKFSDGTPLTIKDVLFNLYVYLDPVYTGSATIYSTKIVGLDKYRFNEDRDSFDSDYTETLESEYHTAAIIRRDDLIKSMKYVSNNYTSTTDKPQSVDDLAHKSGSNVTKTGQAVLDQAKADMKTLSEEFKKELESDWNGIVLESYKEMNNPTKWMIFLHNDGQVREGLLKQNVDNTFVEIDGNRQFLDQDDQSIVNYKNEMAAWYKEHNLPNNDEGKAWAINSVYSTYFPAFMNAADDTENVGYDLTRLNISNLKMLLGSWMSGETVYQKFFTEARSESILNNANGIRSIEGITTEKATTFNGKGLDGEHDVLSITIEDVDPKAIWNFGFTVAPMHYYSNSEYVNKFYWDPADPENAKTCFGFPKGDIKFFDNVINGPEKVKLPMGAGTYKAFSGSVGTAVTGDNFRSGGLINYERNEYFTTLGSGINNAKIKYFRYKEVESDQIINSLLNGDIDYGEPNATTENQEAIKGDIKQVTIETSGYGYVGISPRFIPDVVVRRAIMKAMDTSIILNNYYKGGLAEIIYRPMSKTSWAYPKTATVFRDDARGLDYRYDTSGKEIRDMIEDAGYTKGTDGIYSKEMPGFGEGSLRLEFKFTIAGGTNDHPAYAMFLNAVDILNKKCGGWKVKVENSTTALSDMATGKLTVWAAAWSSTIDPDMYQVYHKDSQATSVKLWGYPQIKNGKTTLYSYEWGIIQELSDLIDEGRSKLKNEERVQSYYDALDLVMELAVEMPTYQRKDMMAYNSKVIDETSLTPENERTAYNGLTSRIWEVTFR